MNRGAPFKNRGGFTLLEMLIALGLGILLVGSIGASLFVYLQTEQSGREKLERAQIARAIYFKMSTDLRSVVYRDLIEEATDEEGVTASEDTLEDQAENQQAEVLSPEEAYGSTYIGLYGNTETLVVNIARPQRLKPNVASSGESEETGGTAVASDLVYEGSGLRSVSWFLVSGEEGSGGLSRTEGESLRVLYDPTGFELDGLAGDADILAPEVTSLAFRYFDGVDWVDEWDSNAQERLPNAVEVTIGFQAQTIQENEYLGSTSDAGAETMRFVIALPLAPAPLTEVQI